MKGVQDDVMHGGSVWSVDELTHFGVGNKLMHGVVGRTDKLIHCGSVGRVDKLSQRRRGESG